MSGIATYLGRSTVFQKPSVVPDVTKIAPKLAEGLRQGTKTDTTTPKAPDLKAAPKRNQFGRKDTGKDDFGGTYGGSGALPGKPLDNWKKNNGLQDDGDT